MRSLIPRSNRGTEIRFLQAWLNQFNGEKLKVDGCYGNGTKQAVMRYQSANGLSVDGCAGQVTLNSMGFVTTTNNNIVMLKIPFDKINHGNVLLENGKAFSCKKFADKGYDIVWNGAHFQMSTRRIVQLVMVAGKVVQYGLGYVGFAYPNNGGKIVEVNFGEVTNKPYDLQGGAPMLISNYKVNNVAISSFDSRLMKSRTKRNCTGLTEDSIVLMFSVANMSFYDMINEGIKQKLKSMMGNDCGGSQSLYMGGADVIKTDGRAIPCAVGLVVKK